MKVKGTRSCCSRKKLFFFTLESAFLRLIGMSLASTVVSLIHFTSCMPPFSCRETILWM